MIMNDLWKKILPHIRDAMVGLGYAFIIILTVILMGPVETVFRYLSL